MRVKINGQDMERGTRITIQDDEYTDAEAWGVVLLGTLAAIGWWYIWR